MFEFQQLFNDLHPERLKECHKDAMMKQGAQMSELYKSGKYPQEYQKPIGCQLELTHECNLRCLQCYNCSGAKRPEMSVKQWMGVARQMADMGVFECVISGGEPLLLKDDLYKIMSILDDAGVRFIFITNGLLGTKEKIERLSKYDYSWFQVSIDGHSEEVHDEIRGVKGSWKQATSTASYVNEVGLPLVISHVIMRQNLPFIPEAMENFYALGAMRVMTGKFIYSGRAVHNKDMIDLTEEQENELAVTLEGLQKKWSKKMDISVPTDPAMYLRMRMLEPPSVMLIRPNGDVKLDCTLPFKIGNAQEQPLYEIWQKSGKNAWRNAVIREWVEKIRCSKDMLSVFPRPYVDEAISIG